MVGDVMIFVVMGVGLVLYTGGIARLMCSNKRNKGSAISVLLIVLGSVLYLGALIGVR